jgi:hypothetical protein
MALVAPPLGEKKTSQVGEDLAAGWPYEGGQCKDAHQSKDFPHIWYCRSHSNANSKMRLEVATAFLFCRRNSSSGVTAGRIWADMRMTLFSLSTVMSEMHFLRSDFFL